MSGRGKGGKGLGGRSIPIKPFVDLIELQRCFRPSTYVVEYRGRRGRHEKSNPPLLLHLGGGDDDTKNNQNNGVPSTPFETIFASAPSMWTFLTTFEHFRMSRVSKAMRNSAMSEEHLWRLRHQREFWHTAREFHDSKEDTTVDYDRFCEENGWGGDHDRPDFWQIFTRGNVLRSVHIASTKRAGAWRDDDEAYYAVDERVMIFDSAEECQKEEETICSRYRDQMKRNESINFRDAYFKRSLPCWIFAIGKEEDLHDNHAPLHASKIGGTPPKYPRPGEDQDRHGDRYSRDNGVAFLFQVDLATVPIRLREQLGGSGLLQFFFDNEAWSDNGGFKIRSIPSNDFHQLLPGTPNGEVDGAPIVGWTEKDDFSDRHDDCDHVKFGGFGCDYQNGLCEPSVQKNNKDGLLSMNIFEIRSAGNIFNVFLGDYGTSILWGSLDNCIWSCG